MMFAQRRSMVCVIVDFTHFVQIDFHYQCVSDENFPYGIVKVYDVDDSLNTAPFIYFMACLDILALILFLCGQTNK